MGRASASPAPSRPKRESSSKAPAAPKAANSMVSSLLKWAHMPWAITLGIFALAVRSAWLKAIVLKAVNGMGDFPLIDAFHATAVAFEYRATANERQGTLQRLVAIVVTALGGTTAMSFLIGQPCGWLCDNQTLTAYIVAWFALHHMPGDVIFRALDYSSGTRFAVTFLDDISWGVAITKWGMFKALDAMHEAPRPSGVAALLAGCVAGCGGGVAQQMCSLVEAEWKLKTPDAFRGSVLDVSKGFGVKASACMVLLAYCLLDPHDNVKSFVHPGWQRMDRESVIFTAVVGMVCAATVRGEVAKQLGKLSQ